LHGNLFIGMRLTIFKLTDIKPNLTFHLATFQCWHERLSNSAYLRTVVVAFFERHCPQIIAWFDMNSSSAQIQLLNLLNFQEVRMMPLITSVDFKSCFSSFMEASTKWLFSIIILHLKQREQHRTSIAYQIISTAISIDICYYHSESVVFSRPGSRSSCRSPE
jgi:hypothetical protein